MDPLVQIAQKIIEKQSTIIGPIAVEQAQSIPGLNVRWDNNSHEVSFTGDGVKLVDSLVRKYEALFGKISVEVCKEAASSLLSKLPESKHPKTLE